MVQSIRFSGLASGLDTQSIVDSMMRTERLPLDRLNQRKQVLEWQRDDFREMNKLLKDFDTFLFDNIFKQSKMLKRATNISNSNLVSATASAEAGNVSYDIKNVVLATTARIQGSAISKDNSNKIDPTKSLFSQKDKLEGFTWRQETVPTNNFRSPEGGGIEFQLSKGAVSDLPTEVEVSRVGGDPSTFKVVKGTSIPKLEDRKADEVYIDENTGKVVFGTRLEKDSTFKIDFKHNYLDLNIKTYNEDGTENTKKDNFKIAGTTSLNSMFNEINKSNVGVNMFYDSGTDKVVVQRTASGDLRGKESGSSIEFHGDSADFFNKALKLDASNVNNTDTVKQDGTDAKFTINGLETTRKSNTFTMNDVTFTLNKSTVTGMDAEGNPTFSDESSTVGVKTDTDAIVGTIREFVEKYNELIGKINGKLTEERFPSFTPLNAEQKAAMKEKEIEDWEEKAKSGLLRRDSLLSSGLSTMRMDLYAQVVSNDKTLTDDKYNQLSEIGITTTRDFMERGKLEIDEDKLRAAIEDNPEAIYQLFMADGNQVNGKTRHEEQGIARRLRQSITDTMQKIEEKAGNTFRTEHNYAMGKNLLRMKDDIARLEERLKQREQRYWNQFNSMEAAMQRLNDQSSQLWAQLGMNNQ